MMDGAMHKSLIVVPLLLMVALCCTLGSEVQAACPCQCIDGQLQSHCRPWDLDQAQPCIGVCRPPSPAPPNVAPLIIRNMQRREQDDRLRPRIWRGWPANELGAPSSD